MRESLTPARVLDAATALLERHGVRQFSMRRLAAELGVAPTAIYWHVGNREELLDAVVERAGGILGAVGTAGDSPVARILSTATSVAANIDRHRWLVELAHQRGVLLDLLGPARWAIAADFTAAGLTGTRVADATNGVMQLVGEHVTFERYAVDWPAQAVAAGAREAAGPGLDEEAVVALARTPDRARTFTVMLSALVHGLLTRPGDDPDAAAG
ncbi:helix-turn-helix domain-containing protein [Frankia sp. AgB32]|uniref:TetR/AcrR family transcriptional regulator n=1 Tax=Frankia sp. AgB32 TaxID=631119 RepID=UPI00200C40E8|nr:helix-turn-helix domain-containing protein [Frankia sp. AgB32]MCK9893507.1 TetR/AcrR family transcriptional regulator [Frankia sp. AgB32]